MQRLQLAREKYFADNVVFQEGTAHDIPVSKRFNVVFSNSVLHWCEDKNKVFKQVAKCLDQGGKFGYVTPNNFSVEKQFCTPSDMLSSECRQHMIKRSQIPNSDYLQNLASNNGFVTIYSKEHVREWKFENVYKLIEFHVTHVHEFSFEHYNVEAMKRHYGEGEIVFKMSYTTAVLINS